MQTRCARFPVAGLGLRCSVFGPRRRFGTGYRVPGTGYLSSKNLHTGYARLQDAGCRVGVTKGETDGRTVVLPFGLGMKSLRSYIWTWVVGLWGP
jgi:hypothetical protein